MISQIEHANRFFAKQIFNLFQRSYKVEAELIDAADFPPLKRSLDSIVKSSNQFYAVHVESSLAAVAEVSCESGCLDIQSLTVDPDFFRRGLAGTLLNNLLKMDGIGSANVETAAANAPAIALYKKYGFTQYRQWTPEHGIEKVALKVTL